MIIYPDSGVQIGNSTYVHIPEKLACDGILPTGPVCPWPKPEKLEEDKNQITERTVHVYDKKPDAETHHILHDTAVKASLAKMAKGLLKNVEYAIKDGKVNKEIREERYSICKECPHFIESTKRCSECGCFMEAKTWIGASPDLLCPKNKWPR